VAATRSGLSLPMNSANSLVGNGTKRDDQEQQQVQANEPDDSALQVFGDRIVPEPNGANRGDVGQIRGHRSATERGRCASALAGTSISRTSKVMAIANRPSLKASSRLVGSPRRIGPG